MIDDVPAAGCRCECVCPVWGKKGLGEVVRSEHEQDARSDRGCWEAVCDCVLHSCVFLFGGCGVACCVRSVFGVGWRMWYVGVY